MATFYVDNGLSGTQYVYHTATGYECIANHVGNKTGTPDRIKLFVRHIVNRDGFACTEVGLSGLHAYEKQESLENLLIELQEGGFRLVQDFDQAKDGESVLCGHISPDSDSVVLRVNRDKDGIKKVMNALDYYLHDESKKFVYEQESVQDVLYYSLYYALGNEMEKGPRGKKGAEKHVRELVEQFEGKRYG